MYLFQPEFVTLSLKIKNTIGPFSETAYIKIKIVCPYLLKNSDIKFNNAYYLAGIRKKIISLL